MKNQINEEVKSWLKKVSAFNDSALDRKWEWQGYDEGIRFAFFRILEELRALVNNEEIFPKEIHRNESATVQQYLIHFHQVYWDLRVLLSFIDDPLFDKEPAENEWSLRHIMSHLIDNEWAFYGIFRYGFQFAGTDKDWPEDSIPENFFDEHFDEYGKFSDTLFQMPLVPLLEFFDEKHRILVTDLAKLPDSELEKMLVFWEPEPKNARFRLIRFESHFRQHTIQVEKTLQILLGAPTEVQMLLRACFTAYAVLDARLWFVKHNDKVLKTIWSEKVKPFMQIIEDQVGK